MIAIDLERESAMKGDGLMVIFEKKRKYGGVSSRRVTGGAVLELTS